MVDTIWSLIVIAFILLVCSGFGAFLGRWTGLTPDSDSDSDRFLFSLALGFGSLALLLFGLGLGRLFYVWTIWGLLALLGLVSWRYVGRSAVLAWRLALTPWRLALGLIGSASRNEGIWLLLGLVVAALYSLCVLAGALALPADSAYDVLTYHFGVPSLYLRWHAIRYDPYILHSNFPQLTEMLYLCGLAAKARGAQAIHFVLGVLTAGVCWSLARPYGKLAASAAALIFWLTPVVGWEASVGYDDLSFAFFESLAFLACTRFGERGSRRWLILSGVCQGLALGVKYSAGAFVPILLLYAAYEAWFRSSGDSKRVSSVLKEVLIVGVAAALVALPWYLRTFLWTGNPVFPYYYSLLGGRNWSREAEQYYRQLQLGYGAGRGAPDFFLAPWRLLTIPDRFYEPAGNSAFGLRFGGLGPAYLLLAGVVTWRGLWNRQAGILAILFGLFLAEWFLLMQQVRYLIEALPLLAPMCGIAMATGPVRITPPAPAADASPGTNEQAPGRPSGSGRRGSRRQTASRRRTAGPPRTTAPVTGPAAPPAAPGFLDGVDRLICAVVVIASFAWQTCAVGMLCVLPSSTSGQTSAAMLDLGLIDKGQYLSDRLPDLWPVSEWVSENTPEKSKIVIIGEPRYYYMNREVAWGNGLEQGKIRYAGMSGPGDLVRTLRDQGFSYVVVRLGTPLGLVAQYGHLPSRGTPADWGELDLKRTDAHWLALYAGAVRQGLLERVYPGESYGPVDGGGYAVYRIAGEG